MERTAMAWVGILVFDTIAWYNKQLWAYCVTCYDNVLFPRYKLTLYVYLFGVLVVNTVT